MTRKELREIGIYAIATMILTVGIFSARTAISQDTKTPPPPKVKIQGLETWATIAPGEQPNTALVRLFINNPTTENKTLDCKINLVRNDFAGNPLSRSPRASDNKQTVERCQKAKIKLKGGATADMYWTWEINARPPSDKTMAFVSVPLYMVTTEDAESVSTSVPTNSNVSNTVTIVNGSAAPRKSVGVTLAQISANAIWNKK